MAKGEVSNYMPDYYKGVYEMEKLLEAEDFVLGGFGNEEMRTLYNEYVMPADLQGVQIFEDQLGIVPGSDETLDQRKQTILMHMLPPQPITVRFMRRFFKQMKLPVTFDVDYPARFAITNGKTGLNNKDNLTPPQIRQVQYILNVYLPANMGKNIRIALPPQHAAALMHIGGKSIYHTKLIIKSDMIHVPDPMVAPQVRIGGKLINRTHTIINTREDK